MVRYIADINRRQQDQQKRQGIWEGGEVRIKHLSKVVSFGLKSWTREPPRQMKPILSKVQKSLQ